MIEGLYSYFTKSTVPDTAAEPPNPVLVIKWGTNRLQLPFEREGPCSLEETTLGELRELIKKVTGVPANGQKLVFSGAVMKDNNAKLTSFGLHGSSTVLLIGSKPDARDLARTTTGSAEEHVLLSRISRCLEKTRTSVLPRIEQFESEAHRYLIETPHDEHIRDGLYDTHHYVVETLMQALLSLDDVVCAAEFEIARRRRREAVKFTQGLIDRADKIKEQLDSALSASEGAVAGTTEEETAASSQQPAPAQF